MNMPNEVFLPKCAKCRKGWGDVRAGGGFARYSGRASVGQRWPQLSLLVVSALYNRNHM